MDKMLCKKCNASLDEGSSRCSACGEEVPPMRLSQAPTQPGPSRPDRPLPCDFGRFRLLREIGRGGMGVVYEAEDRQLVRTVALKTLFEREGGQHFEARFLQEARIAGTLDHPNLVPVYDYGTIDGLAYYTMPLVRGLSLEAIIPLLHARGRGSATGSLAIPSEPSQRVRLVLEWLEGAL